MKNTHGFTLIETMIIIAVLGILASLAIPSFISTIEQTKARKTADFMVELINYAKSEALNKNVEVYFTVANNTACTSKTVAHGCEVRSDPIEKGVTVTITDSDGNGELIFDGIHGIPNTPATISVTANASTKNISLNLLGMATVSK